MNKEEFHQWLRALIYSFLVFAFFSIYLYIRREIFNLYILNKVFGSTAAVVAGFTLIIGPLHRYFSSFAHFMGIRKELGFIAFGLAIAHVIATLMLQDRFKFPEFYLKVNYPLYFGIIAVLIWAYMAFISRVSKIKEMGSAVWISSLSLCGKIAFLAIFLHLTVMKYPGWITWFKGQTKQTPELANPSYPPASLVVFAIMLIIILFRIINDFVYRKAEKAIPIKTPPQNPQNSTPSPDKTPQNPILNWPESTLNNIISLKWTKRILKNASRKPVNY